MLFFFNSFYFKSKLFIKHFDITNYYYYYNKKKTSFHYKKQMI